MANNRHSWNEVTISMQRQKYKHRKALITVEDMAYMTNQMHKNPRDDDK